MLMSLRQMPDHAVLVTAARVGLNESLIAGISGSAWAIKWRCPVNFGWFRPPSSSSSSHSLRRRLSTALIRNI